MTNGNSSATALESGVQKAQDEKPKYSARARYRLPLSSLKNGNSNALSVESTTKKLPCFLSIDDGWRSWACVPTEQASSTIFRKQTNNKSVLCLLCGLTLKRTSSWETHCNGKHHQKTFSLLRRMKKMHSREAARFGSLLRKIKQSEDSNDGSITAHQKRTLYTKLVSGIENSKNSPAANNSAPCCDYPHDGQGRTIRQDSAETNCDGIHNGNCSADDEENERGGLTQEENEEFGENSKTTPINSPVMTQREASVEQGDNKLIPTMNIEQENQHEHTYLEARGQSLTRVEVGQKKAAENKNELSSCAIPRLEETTLSFESDQTMSICAFPVETKGYESRHLNSMQNLDVYREDAVSSEEPGLVRDTVLSTARAGALLPLGLGVTAATYHSTSSATSDLGIQEQNNCSFADGKATSVDQHSVGRKDEAEPLNESSLGLQVIERGESKLNFAKKRASSCIAALAFLDVF